MEHALTLAFGLSFTDLYDREGLVRLDQKFLAWLNSKAPALYPALLAGRAQPEGLNAKEASELLLALAPWLEAFLAEVFGIEAELENLIQTHHNLTPLYRCKRLFVQRRAAKLLKPDEAANLTLAETLPPLEALLGEPYNEEAFATATCRWMEAEATYSTELETAARFAACVLYNPEAQKTYGHSLLYQTPQKLDMEHLVPVETVERDGVTMLALPQHHRRQREGFHLTDAGASLKQALDEAHYCIYCQPQGKDSCSKGLKEKDGSFKKSTTSVTLAGCPLEEHISEMNQLKAEGVPLGALAMAIINNPMLAGTGHRICNDCMKSCIYQKQQPVNIPQIETRTLKDVLNLPWGFEIYSLLTRWNPLNLHRPLPKPSSGYKVLVVGLGPAGYTLAHHLLNDGHTVVAVDGLKIEPEAPALSGRTPMLEAAPFEPIRSITSFWRDLATRPQAGFGGVAEYGITVRWDKNFLTSIRLLLERRSDFLMFGGIRFGSNITLEDAWDLGFDHIALCMGAGRPTLLNIPNAMAKGVRTASDFLMALQLTGAAKADSIANLHLRLPVVVVGGGLTAIDTATEALAYYPMQVEKFRHRYETLLKTKSEAQIRHGWSEEDHSIANEWLTHAHALTAERQKPTPNLQALLDSWGGATVAYRRRLQDAPSYRLNHEEVELAMQEGIQFLENFTPTAIETDAHGAAIALTGKGADGSPISLPARSIFIAAGTQPNTVLARERADIPLHGGYFQALDETGQPTQPEKLAKPSHASILMQHAPNQRSMSFLGDLHPSFAGNVVKAMGSAKQGYPVISRTLAKAPPANTQPNSVFFDGLRQNWLASVHAVNRLTPTIVEVILHAPAAAQRFEPGQFYRLQNYEAFAPLRQNTRLAMEGLALTGAWVDKEKGLLATIVLEMGGSSNLCAQLQPGEPVVLMGPTGTPTHIPESTSVLLAGGGLGNAVLFSIGQAMRQKGCRVLYFAGYRRAEDRFHQEQIEAAADQIIWCTDTAPQTPITHRPEDATFTGNIIAAMRAYADGQLGAATIPLSDITHLIAIGSDRMMAAAATARHGLLNNVLNPNHIAIGSINSPMQCMMKEICAQCLQKHIDPKTGEESYIFSCFNQDQPLDNVCFNHLNSRLTQNRLQESLTSQWLEVSD